MELAVRIEEVVAPTVEAAGFRVVRVVVSGRDRPRLQVMAERIDERPITVDDCALVSRVLSAALDVADPFPGPYTLEVSSPGIERPLVRLADFERFAGRQARIELSRPIEGRHRFHGRLLGAGDGMVRIEVDGEEVALSHAEVAKARLVVNDILSVKSKERHGR